MRRFRLFAVLRQFCHGIKEAPCAPRRWHLCQTSRDLTVNCKQLQFWEGEMTNAVMPSHEFGLVISGGEMEFLVLLGRWSWIKREGAHAGGAVRFPLWADLSRRGLVCSVACLFVGWCQLILFIIDIFFGNKFPFVEGVVSSMAWKLKNVLMAEEGGIECLERGSICTIGKGWRGQIHYRDVGRRVVRY